MTDHYAVFGNPIQHSKSPQLHTQFAAQTAQDLVYEKVLAEIGGFPAAVEHFRQHGGCGLNVTVPFKEDAWQLADQLTHRAERARAVNTLYWQDEVLVGDNTDGVGLVTDLTRNHQVELAGANILLLGAGGAVRGVLAPLLAEKPRQLVIANRTASKAAQLANDFADLGAITGGGFAELAGQSFNIIINGTAASLAGDVPPLPDGVLAEHAFVYDMMYSQTPTAFLRWAAAHGVMQMADGWGMLVEQAAEAFRVWRGVLPDTAAVLASRI